MSIKFSALEIGSGDAFLVEDDERKILFDSGGSKTTLEDLLIKKILQNSIWQSARIMM